MFSSVKPRRSHVFAATVAAAALAVPAFAAAAKAPATTTNLSGTAGYCQTGGTGAPTGPALGSATLTAPAATSAGVHQVSVGVKARANKLAPGTYDVYLVNIFRDDAVEDPPVSAIARNRLRRPNGDECPGVDPGQSSVVAVPVPVVPAPAVNWTAR